MSLPRGPDDWLPLQCLDAQFQANIAVLTTRYPVMADAIRRLPESQVMIRVRGDLLDFGTPSPDGSIAIEPNLLPAASAQLIVNQLFPTGQCTQPVLVAGLDQAWLWLKLQSLEVSTPGAPGHRPPLYFLCGNLDRLRAVLHIHDLRDLLGDSRVNIFCGPNAVDQFLTAAIDTPQSPLPRLSVTVEPALWQNGATLDTTLRTIGSAWEASFAELQTDLQMVDARFDAASLAEQIRDGRSLRVLGITSKYTTFLQYSMRDWLESLRSHGHETRLIIETADHEQIHPLNTARACLDFQPDLVVLIDHFRAGLAGLPQRIPCVMWVQDRLSHLFQKSAGIAQQPTDYAIGQGRVECVHTHDYPSARFMPAMIGTNPRRFDFIPVDDAKAACDVSFVSHASVAADEIIQAEIDRLGTPQAATLLRGIFDQFRAIYDAGECITQPHRIEALIRRTMLDTQTTVPNPQPLLDLFTHRVNNALYRHQVIGWVAEMGVDLRLYGRGWESHPQFARFARGVADNESQLAAVYQSSRINLQITPFGAAHQRLFDGLSAGGFFLMRRCLGDRFDQILRDLWRWCVEHKIRSDEMLLRCADEPVQKYLAELEEIDGRSVIGRGYEFVDELAVTANEGFIRSAGTIWPEFDDVSFDTQDELRQKIRYFLAAPDRRDQLNRSMRQRVLESVTYQATSERMLRFIANDLSRGCSTGILPVVSKLRTGKMPVLQNMGTFSG